MAVWIYNSDSNWYQNIEPPTQPGTGKQGQHLLYTKCTIQRKNTV
jgi:hypothetical protein